MLVADLKTHPELPGGALCLGSDCRAGRHTGAAGELDAVTAPVGGGGRGPAGPGPGVRHAGCGPGGAEPAGRGRPGGQGPGRTVTVRVTPPTVLGRDLPDVRVETPEVGVGTPGLTARP